MDVESQALKWRHLKPRDCIQVTQQVWLTSRELQFIAQLYAPFLGNQATVLYWILFAELSPNTYESEVFRLADLLAMVNMGIPDFYQARVRLEAVGLLKTYHYEDESAATTQYTLELQAPASPSLFFKDALLSTLLINQVGHQRFEQLQKRFLRQNVSERGIDVTSDFEQGFQMPFNVQHYRRNRALEKQFVQDLKQQQPLQVPSKVDWQLLQDLLESQFVSKAALNDEIKKIIETLNVYYGLTEKEIAHYVIYAADLSTGEIDAAELLKIVLDAAQQLSDQTKIIQSEIKEESQEEYQNTKKLINEMSTSPKMHKQYSQTIQQLITVAEQLPPSDFVTSIKKQRKGYVTASEQRLLLELVQRSGLSSGVINILIHYLLVVKNHPTLTKNLTETIANDWAQKNVKTALEAIELVRERGKHQTIPRKNSQYSRKNNQWSSSTKNVHVEVLPDWAKKSVIDSEDPVDQQDYDDLKAQIATLKTSQESGS